MTSRIMSWIGVKTEDKRKLLMLLPVFFLCGISEMLGYNGYMTLFNERFGSEYLPYVYAAEAILLPLEAWFMSWLTGKLRKPQLMRALFLLMGAIITLNTVILLTVRVSGADVRAYYPFLFLSSSFVVRQQTILLWSLAIDLCPTQQAKRLMPLFVSSAAMGGIASGLLAQGISSFLGADAVYMMAPLFLLAGGFNYWRSIARYLVPLTLKEIHASGDHSAEAAASSTYYFKKAFTWPYMISAAAIMTLMPALYFLLEYEFLNVIRTVYTTESEFAAFLGKVTSLLFTLALVLQLVSGRLSAWLGPSNMLAVIAAVFLGGFLTVSLTLGSTAILLTISLAYMFFYVLLYYFAEPANQMFFKLLPLSERDGYRYVVQGVSVSLGIMLGAGLQWLHAGLGLGLTLLAVIGAAGSILLIWVTRIGRRLYMEELVGSVQTMTTSGAVSTDSLQELLRHGRLTSVLRELMNHRNDYAREVALELAAQTRDVSLQPRLVELLRDPGARIRSAALRALDPASLGTEASSQVAAALADKDFDVRSEAIRVVGRAPATRERLKEYLYPMLEDAHPQVVVAAVKVLYALQDEDSKEACRWVISHFLQTGGEPVVAICELIASLGLTEYAPDVAGLLGDPSPAVRQASIESLGRLGYVEAIPMLLEQLADSEPILREAVAEAFVRMGSEAVEPLLAALPRIEPKVWSTVIRALSSLLGEEQSRQRLVPEVLEMLLELWNCRQAPKLIRRAGYEGLAGLAELRLTELRGFVMDGAWAVMEVMTEPAVVQSIRLASEDEDEEIRESGLEMLAEGMGEKRLSAAILRQLAEDAEGTPSGREAADALAGDGLDAEAGIMLRHIRLLRDRWLSEIAEASLQQKEVAMANGDRHLFGLLDKVVFLKEVPYFSGLSLEELGRIAAIAEEQFHPEGTRMFRQGEPNPTFGVIVEGHLRITTHLDDGEEKEVAMLRRTFVYGESSSLYGTLTTASGTAVDGELHILAIRGEELGKLTRLYPGIGIGMLRSAFDRVRRLERTIAGKE
ncbi:HEAT repeat domain-containing protein [Paenibacillus silviterrae]|uniref:HEAT repeat domain-containing protein n=1 Tax=Paenibacillus silviterrae TaxID=3242194 RepID=UPI002543B309|nr:HEAT repeat domain-containing protein [Paenibacillus chinjuensis]